MSRQSLLDPLGALDSLDVHGRSIAIYRLDTLERQGLCNLARLPYSIRILLEAILRNCDNKIITTGDVENLAGWNAQNYLAKELAFKPARVLLQDFTGVPALVDLAALRSAMERMGGDPGRINPVVPADLVIDHSVQVDRFGSLLALAYNAQREFERNRERYEFLRWGQTAFDNFRVVPPATGIVHQVNLEYLADVVITQPVNGRMVAFPDTLVGTDSHTTMINGLGVAGWGVGGIEAEAVMLGQPYYMLTPQVVGAKLSGRLPEGATATDLVLTITQMLRARGVVGKFVEYYGPGLSALSLEDRATIANMSPEYGATMGFFPVDANTLDYLRATGRPPELVDLVEKYTKEQHLFRTDDTPDPMYNDRLELDLGKIEPSLAGPKRPQDRILLKEMIKSFHISMNETIQRPIKSAEGLKDGDVVIAAITSCTNTSNPSVMIGAGLLAKKAVERGLRVPAKVKTSLAPGSKVVTNYLDTLGLTPYLQALGFHVVGYGCTSCIGNSGPLPEFIASTIKEHDLVVASVLSGNRNFEGRVHPLTKINYLASPPLVVAYALAGTVDIDLTTDPIGQDPNGQPVYLGDIWPGQDEIRQEAGKALSPEIFRSEYGRVFQGDETWNRIQIPEGKVFSWDPESTYIREPPFFCDLTTEVQPAAPIHGARVLALLGDSVTTDHISPAGAIPLSSPAGSYLLGHDVEWRDFNSFGSRRGNHEVMMRGTFGNIRLRNLLLPGSEGGVTLHIPSGEEMSIYDAAMRYQEEQTPLIVIAGKEYGTGSSRDWAAKGTILLGVRAVLVESYERIHRSNLIGMGVLPLQFIEGENASTFGLTGREAYDIDIPDDIQPGQTLTVRAIDPAGKVKYISAIVRIDTAVEIDYYHNGGVLHAVLRSMLRQSEMKLARRNGFSRLDSYV
ncbi:MAG: aconitate hydratase AcnA [Anaerolineales bacterium]|nr:aconitate hydratase AcnA [Anaerolineales bacterium]